MASEPAIVHATCVALRMAPARWAAALFLGPSGSGKSDLALRLVHGGGPESCRLVADDYVEVRRRRDDVVAGPPAGLAGKIEVRGVGLLDVPWLAEAPLVAAFRLVSAADVPRLPGSRHIDLCELVQGPLDGPARLRLFQLAPFEASAVAKVVLGVHLAAGTRFGE